MSTGSLIRGGNAPVPLSDILISVSWRSGSPVDVIAFLLDAAGKVRDDSDLVFYNQPRHPSGSVSLEANAGHSASLSTLLSRVEADVHRIVLAGSVDQGSFDQVDDLALHVKDGQGHILAEFRPRGIERVSALIFGELYRRQGGWKFRAVGQGWSGGLAALVAEHGVEVEDEPGEQRTCEACGTSLPARQERCLACDRQRRRFLYDWRYRAKAVLNGTGPVGAQWDRLWTDLQQQGISIHDGRQLFRPTALSHLEKLVTFAFADGVIEPTEMAEFETAVRSLGVIDPAVTRMRQRMQRGLQLSEIRSGALPQADAGLLHLDPDELVHLNTEARHVRLLASGPREYTGQLMATNRKLRFVADTGGHEMPWSKVLSVEQEVGRIRIQTSTSKGGTYLIPDAEHAEAVLIGTLRVAKRLVFVPGERDTRSIPQHVKVAVWQRDQGACVQCSAAEYLEFDHVIPYSRGGATSVDNLQLLCFRVLVSHLLFKEEAPLL